jgi:hypothetical protein
MSKYIYIFLLSTMFNIYISQAQKPASLLGDTVMLNEIELGLKHIYNIDTQKALKVYELLAMQYPEHPATPFFKGLIIYWSHYPLNPKSDKHQEFISLMEDVVDKAYDMWHKNDMDIEGVFFDIMGRAFLMMYYADNGLSGKVIKLAPAAYRNAMKSFELSKLFNEYYFVVGLYNYYIEAYPEKNPVYKPVTLFFKDGDKQQGIEYLEYTKDNTVFMKVEAAIFLAIIYYDFEHDVEKAIETMGKLWEQYPENPFFISQYIEYLLHNREYQKGEKLNQLMVRKHRKIDYIVLKGIVFKALIEEKHLRDYKNAYKHYQMGVNIAEKMGAMGEDFLSYALFGLSRIEQVNGNTQKSKEFEKRAMSFSRYDHFSD